MNEIKQRVLPELTDEFVKSSSRFSTVDELKADIQNYLDNQRESMKRTSAENAIFKSLIDSTSVDIPQSMINREVNALRGDYQQRLSAQGVDWNKFIQSQGGESNFNANLVNDAKARIKNSLIIDKISKEENISVQQSDFSVKQFGNNPNFLNSLSQQIINEKVRNFLIDNNKFEYVEVEPKKEEVSA